MPSLRMPVASIRTVVSPDAGYVIEVEALEPLNAELYKQKRTELMRSLMSKEGMRAVQGFIASLEKNAKIKTNKSFLGRP